MFLELGDEKKWSWDGCVGQIVGAVGKSFVKSSV